VIPHPDSDEGEQQKMRFVEEEKYVRDGVAYEVAYEPSGIVTCTEPEGMYHVPEPGDPGWVSYKVTFAAAKAESDVEFKSIKISPHSAAGRALVKKA
jgi:hypothetical protein